MKKLGAFLLGVGMLAGVTVAADSNTATSVNIVGFANRVLPPNNLIMCGAGFMPMGAGGINVVFTNQLVGAKTSASSDLIIKWDSVGQVYETAWKVSGATAGNAVYNEMWYVDDGEWPPTPSPMTFKSGDGFWIQNQHSYTQQVVLAGEVSASLVLTNQLNTQLNMVSYPFATATDVNDSTNGLLAVATGAKTSASSDLIISWDVNSQSYVTYWKVSGATGGNAIYNGKWYLDDGEWPPNLPTGLINVGEGFWFLRNVSGSIDWITGRPYTL